MLRAQPDDHAVARVELHRAAGDEIGVERIDRIRMRLPRPFDDLVGELVGQGRALCAANRDAFAHQAAHHFRHAFVVRDFGGAAGDGADDAGAVDRELAPRGGDEIGGGLGGDDGVGEQGDERRACLALGNEDRAVAALDDAAGRGALGGQVDDHRDGAPGRHHREALALLDAVLDHGEPGGRAHQPGEPRRGGGTIIGLGGREHPIDGGCGGRIGQDARRRLERPFGRFDLEIGERRPCADGHVVRLGEPGGERAADRACADHRDPRHRMPPR